MSFTAMAAWQAWLLVAGAAAFATWLFFLKVRPPRVFVSSLTLWGRVLDESRALTWWERVRRAVSLFLVLLTTAALALAIARPGARASLSSSATTGAGAAAAVPGNRVLIVVDSSWSMLARTATGETRWDRAIREARALAASAGGDDVALATTADGLIEEPTTDAALIESALDRIAPSGGEASAWPRVTGARAVHFITDGAIARRLDSDVTIHSVFETASNVAITAFEVRAAQQADLAGEAYLEVANYSPTGQSVHVVLSRGAAAVFDRRIDMNAGEAIREVVPLGREGGAELRARVEASHDALVVDNEAVAWITRAKPVAITVVSDQPAPFGVLLQRDPDVAVSLASPSSYRPGNEDVVIFDRWVPRDSPTAPALYFAPPGSAWLGQPGTDEKQPRWTTAGSHPVVRGVDPMTLTIARAHAYDAPDLVALARSDAGTPLVYAAESATSRRVVVTFSPAESNLAFAPAFPILMGNAIEWLAHLESGGSRRPGLSIFGASVSRLIGPNGRPVPLAHVGDATTAMLRAPGLYVEEGGGARSVVPINIGDPQVSNLTRTSLSESQRAAAVRAGASPGAWWLYAVALAFVIVAGEWWTWQRRITV